MPGLPPFTRKAIIAAIAGSVGGGTIGLWSVWSSRHLPAGGGELPIVGAVVASPVLSLEQPPARSAAEPAATAGSPAGAAPHLAANAAPAALPRAAALPRQAAPPPAAETGDPLPRARELAQRPDVRALLALREGIVRRAGERGEEESAETRRRLDQVDRYLAEARALRLRLDAGELRQSQAASPAP